ncbi:RecQ family ATP-dependent DNA helicase [Basilea psittacipulmonis]|uniref:DNA 3'-5' helicase n=1 Tax=Basilea psittacipulmonis DSM 24701 TaxID=1072685 RepID=A0A077DE25_9BURK|nr:RecQ family ATP-dependent DNA helicase [Basilea psittacipulmonis]AIL32909.1 ATP-binding protein [Basilea psittacipulmonis DSM 24701]
MDQQKIELEAMKILKSAYGENATFRDDQLEAIVSVVKKQKTLVVQKTGWGKSLVYFIATKLLKKPSSPIPPNVPNIFRSLYSTSGPTTLIISPLLALMNNQVEAAQKLGVNAVTINSEKSKDEENAIYANLHNIDALIVSPERLSNATFMKKLEQITTLELIVVDEAHCISEWGHDFRPDYQRILYLLQNLPANVAILGTTATANERVIKDIRQQLGEDTQVFKGPLVKKNLAIQINPSQNFSERMAWLLSVLSPGGKLHGLQGIVYCLTTRECHRIASLLKENHILAEEYHGSLDKEESASYLDKFYRNEINVLVATTKLGMGYDKHDVRFVIHYQLPQNLIAYYQQIGRAGRDGKLSYAVLLHGSEDDEIIDFFNKGSLASPQGLDEIISLAKNGVKQTEIMEKMNLKTGIIGSSLKYLETHRYIYKENSIYRKNLMNNFNIAQEAEKQQRLRESKQNEYKALKEYSTKKECLMQAVAKELDAPDGYETCGVCAVCQGKELFSTMNILENDIRKVDEFLKCTTGKISPRIKFADRSNIPVKLRMQEGWVLTDMYYSLLGQKVKAGKYIDNRFSDELLAESVALLKDEVAGLGIDTVVAIPSLNRPELVPDFAHRLSDALGLRFVPQALFKTKPSHEQKTQSNSVLQESNVRDSLGCDPRYIKDSIILLVDDMVDSRWTFTVASELLLRNGAKAVYPFALVQTGSAD